MQVSYLILMILLHEELISDHLQLQNHLGEAPLLVYEGLAAEGLLQGGTMRVQLGIAANHTTQAKISITVKENARVFDAEAINYSERCLKFNALVSTALLFVPAR